MATAGGPSAGVSSLPSFVAVINKFAGVPLADIGISSFSVSANKSPEERNTGCPGHGIRTQPLLKAKQGRSSRSRFLVSLLLIFNFFFFFFCFNFRFFFKVSILCSFYFLWFVFHPRPPAKDRRLAFD
jgi:hypothetical protein